MSISDINWKNDKIPVLSRILLALAGLLLIGTLFYPIWQMELDAPQYPEGLVLYMHADKLAGDVESINGLNHYIGMKTLHTEDFIEFAVLPYIIIFFAALAVISAVVGRKRWVLATLILFAVFGILALVDFYRWNYNYGHDLSPTAAIKVPGMAYQPPLIGYKQLLNFGVYSIPALGGILMLISGLLMVFVVIKDFKFYKIFSKKAVAVTAMTGMIFCLSACGGSNAPQPVKANEDICALCKMTVMDLKFATELVTDKGKYHVFDDISCMIKFVKDDQELTISKMYVPNYLNETELLEYNKAFYVKGGNVKSPMNGNIAAYKTLEDAKASAEQLNAEVVSWQDLGL